MVLTATGFVPIEAGAGGGAQREGEQSAVEQTAQVLQKYSPEQPRVPAGNSQGGQWTREGGSGSSNDSSTRARAVASGGSILQTQYAASETDTRSDTANVPPGVQYAANPSRYAIDPSALTGISQIDDTTQKLLDILVECSDRVGLLRVSPQLYGITIHLEFAAAVIAAGIRGIGISDVEQSFGLPPGYGSGKKVLGPTLSCGMTVAT